MRLLIICLSFVLAACGDNEIDAAKDMVASEMKDPSSVQWKDVKRCNSDRNVVSGEVNAKNSYGAYVGYTAFFYSNGVAALVTNTDDLDKFNELMKSCYGT